MESLHAHTFLEGARHARQLISDWVVEDCTFDGWAGLQPEWSNPDPNLRPTFRNVVLRNTNAYGAYLEGVIVEDVVVEQTKAGKAPIFLRGNAYSRVTLRGRIGATEIRGKMFPPPDLSQERQDQIIADWDAANAEYYESVDWALDITEAEFGSFSVSGIPSRLIRRDPATTAVVTRQSAMEGRWRGLSWSRAIFPIVIGWLLDDGYEDVVLVACKRSRRYKDDLQDLQMLRDSGIAT